MSRENIISLFVVAALVLSGSSAATALVSVTPAEIRVMAEAAMAFLIASIAQMVGLAAKPKVPTIREIVFRGFSAGFSAVALISTLSYAGTLKTLELEIGLAALAGIAGSEKLLWPLLQKVGIKKGA